MKIRYLLIGLFAFAAYAYASNEDYKANQMEHAHACQMIKMGAWPKNVDMTCGEAK